MRLECNLPRLDTQITKLKAKATEKAHRLPDDHLRKLAFENNQQPRMKKSNWRTKSQQLPFQLTSMERRVPLEHFKFPPWNDAPCLEVSSSLEGVQSRMESVQVTRAPSIQRIRKVNADIIIYTCRWICIWRDGDGWYWSCCYRRYS